MLPFHLLLRLICQFCLCISCCFFLISLLSLQPGIVNFYSGFVFIFFFQNLNHYLFVLFLTANQVKDICLSSYKSLEWNVYFHWFTSNFQLLIHTLVFSSNICPDTNMSRMYEGFFFLAVFIDQCMLAEFSFQGCPVNSAIIWGYGISIWSGSALLNLGPALPQLPVSVKIQNRQMI